MYIHDEDIHNKYSSAVIFPILMELLKINSVLDIGCGIGTWLGTAKDLGIEDIYGVDGDYVDRDLLKKHLNAEKFIVHDLNHLLNLERKFDLTICLEVAEHLPKGSAKTIVHSLINHSEVILFSAAIPGQGGQYHLNEQWPDYWAELFTAHDFVFLDIIRHLIWDDPQVDYWYKQNTFLVVKSTHELVSKYAPSHLSLVHPELLDRATKNKDRQIKTLKNQLTIHPLKRWVKSLIK